MYHKTGRDVNKEFAGKLFEGTQKDIIDALKDVFDVDSSWVLDWVEENFAPEDVFDGSELGNWSVENGYIKE